MWVAPSNVGLGIGQWEAVGGGRILCVGHMQQSRSWSGQPYRTLVMRAAKGAVKVAVTAAGPAEAAAPAIHSLHGVPSGASARTMQAMKVGLSPIPQPDMSAS